MGTKGPILVTGGAGFIGSNFIKSAINNYEKVFVIDKLTYAGDKQNLEPTLSDITFIRGDVRDQNLLEEIYPKVDYIVNFAAESHVDRSINSGKQFVQSNVEGAFIAMNELRNHNIERFVQISTDEVYGSILEGKYTEDSRLEPSSPYSASKAGADMFANAFWETYDLPISVVRPTNVYGPRQNPEKLIPKFIIRAIKGKELPVYGDGSNIRQWLYVSDLCDAIHAVINSAGSNVYNVGGTDEKTNLEVTNMILDLVGRSDDLITFVEDRKGHDMRYALDDMRLKSETDFSPSIKFEKGIENTIKWYMSNYDRYQ